MAVGDYLIVFSAILIGLSVADLSLSLHRLVRQARVIRWHPIVPLTGFIVLCLILNLWWGLYRAYSQTTEIEFVEFLPQVMMMLSLFLLAAAVFPDDKLEPDASLLEFYLDNRMHFWGLLATYLLAVIINIGIGGIREGWDLATHFNRAWANALGIVLCGVMMVTQRMVLHWIMVALCLLVIATAWSGARLESIAAG